MKPDAARIDEVRPSPNHTERRLSGGPDMLILHYTGMGTGEGAVRWLCDPQSGVSCHYLVHEDGRVVQMVPEEQRAWHAGEGSWRGRGDVNSRSIGIEIVNVGHGNGYPDFPAAQIASVIELCRECVGRWPIPPEFVLAHSDIAPARKSDPGEKFPWDQLFFAGIGHFVVPAPLRGGRFFGRGDRGGPVSAYQSLLAAYGYAVPIDGVFEDTTHFATVAFQRHFRPERVDGVADASTIETLHRLLTALPRSPFDRDARAPSVA
ncbi:N-acetylmuramoyl-L-alanine amidase [Aurantimonas sp. C2-6-R+9]|uniref:peptidoglycan recognition protein family protein n=1 Tax=unclassified Aurantimonas TaxID=2638230 RepID=UPI002E17BE1E|nr:MULTISPECIES: N-acetylmuramoyl-L-alanine amidase [unclassified Aurantimonas]MEC5290052.1 N-acetylmuramoyl-L-alanine amidase [Aurantimonas sp. C2-3-R2]MEC5381816.1 N-acetylmuramoyl-L-alanine amidase [Aurantimonas sp. C2-6-R+9]MEC5411117.1 N-acetylmuramoyl-L-alanine amidase [Aurantimonas sp. C2-4-R8]